MEISSLTHNEFKVMVLKMLIRLNNGWIQWKHQKDREYENQSELKITKNKIKNILEEVHSRLEEAIWKIG